MKGRAYIKQLRAELEYLDKRLDIIEREERKRSPDKDVMEENWHSVKGRFRKLYDTMRMLTRTKKVKF